MSSHESNSPIQGKSKESASFDQASPTNEGGNTQSPPPFQLKATGGMPQNLVDGFASSTGHDLSDVNVHKNSAKPADVGAHAYAQGNDIHLGPGQEKHLAHEAGHIVQQREGRVTANTSVNGMAVNNDKGLESEADKLGDSALQAKAEPGGMPIQKKSNSGPAQMKVIQRVEDTHWGKFHDKKYDLLDKGLDVDLEFEPGAEVDATKIAFVQVVKSSVDGDPVIIDASQEDRMVDDGSDAEGYRLDRLSTKNNPVYGAPSLGAGKKLEDNSGSNSKFKLGHHYDDGTGIKSQNAFMHDAPKGSKVNNSRREFETTALAIDGEQKGTYYGSVTWGWKRDGSGVLSALPFKKDSEGTPSNKFMAAAEAWNDTTARGTVVTRNNDTPAYTKSGSTYSEDYKLPKDVKVKRIAAYSSSAGVYQKSEILTGTKAGDTRYFKVTDLKDKGDGKATVDLPIEDVHKVKTKVSLNEGLPGPLRYTQELPIGTRVKITSNSYVSPLAFPIDDKVQVEVVDGPHIGANGLIPKSALEDENNKVG